MEGTQSSITRIYGNMSFVKEHKENNTTDKNITSSQLSTKTEIFLYFMEFWGSLEYFICFLANLLTIMAVVKFDYLHRKATNILILSLSIADGLLGESYDF